MNLAKITRTCENILHKRQTDKTGMIRDPRVYVGFIFDLMFCRSLFFAVFVFWFMFSAIMKVFRYFRDRNILYAKYPPISDSTDNLLRTIFRKFCVFPFKNLSENLIPDKRRYFVMNIPLARTV